ncbi:MarR family transcriptional regulator [Brevibacillus sp. MER 51]|uniref:MarR family winged helix-turn-helix transcriptional regulator n=1 Tax=Brevibacillus sp. MER 51 TaxID=2939560 RepID=UPI00204090F2|nr:MarR family transcriptional regulator [Brevibacillus sp. MER 51]MCM3145798.1 MarR family transcriptional regulator [Brevibacillus sp. MER 51]
MNEELVAFVRELNEIEYACQVMLTQEYADVLDETITNSQIIMINLLHERGRLLTGELAKQMDITASAVSQMLNKMEKRQLVKRSINPGNRREIFVELDNAGVNYIETSRKIELSIIERFYSKLPYEDLVALKEIMLKFRRIIEEEQTRKTDE